MRKSFLRKFCLIVPVIFLSLAIVSCTSSKKIKYFQDIPDSGQLKTLPKVEYTPPIIQTDDILTILVETVDMQATASINLANVSLQTAATAVGSLNPNTQVSSGYLVDRDGFVDIPILGKIKLLGYTTAQAQELILKEAVKYFKDPTVTVRYANFKYSVTGEVLKPGVYVIPNEKVTVMDAIASAGDLTIFGKRDNVLLIRENQDGTKSTYRINLNKSTILSSPYYYLRQNDIIYVEPGKGKAAANDASQARTFALLSSLISVLIVVASRITIH